ncbi:MAG TPA: M36 family metallopeptidase [Thermoanaerobaculia bacterium]|nr:M36 family metallopeptidase [Thermoanaerobaculia bacterium]
MPKLRLAARFLFSFLLAAPLFARDLPPIDEFGSARPHPDASTAVASKARGLTRAGMAIPVEARLRVPTFLWPSVDAVPPQSAPDPAPRKGRPEIAAARTHLGHYASLYDLNATDVTNAAVTMVHNTGRGPIIVKLRQQVNGVEIFREELNVVMDRELRLAGLAGYLSSTATPGVQGGLAFRLDDKKAAVGALKDLTGVAVSETAVLRGSARDAYESFTVNGLPLDAPVRLKKVYYHLQGGLTPGYYIEILSRDPASNASDGYAYVISAIDGHILFRNSLVAEAGTPYTYRVWASAAGMPLDSPAGNGALPKVNPVHDGYQAPLLPQTDITIANYPFSKNDPWLPPGSTETLGNNVDAYSDVTSGDGYTSPAPPATPPTGDFRALTTGVDAFQHTYDYALPYHHISRQAATTQLFVTTNFLHDWFYDAGFDEGAGNAQQDNYGRGGVDGDRLFAEAQDNSGMNNANMYTPADGGHPRMQMYYFSGVTVSPSLTITAPAGAAGKRNAATATFGPKDFDVTADVVQPEPLSACTSLTNAALVAGKIVMVDREPTSGDDFCAVATKVANIAEAGAAGIILVNLSGWPDTLYYPGDSIPDFMTPFLSITWNSATSIKAELSLGSTVAGRMLREGVRDRDATIDNQIVAHEWGHYLSNRLIGNANGLTNTQGRGMGEGWSDFVSMLLTVREEDALVASNATWNGIYPAATYSTSGGADGGTNSGYYFGIRRAPYSTDFAKNPFTFKHIEHGVPLPATAPLKLNGLSNAQYHNTGEIWANMLWECYAALLRDTQGGTPRLTFADAQTRMKEYLVASLKLTPATPTLIEARDAVLAAAAANDLADYALFVAAFAKRGLGIGAVAPDRYSVYNQGVLESYFAGGDADVLSSVLSDAGGSCDNDGVLDRGESGALAITIKNSGSVALNGMTGTLTVSTPGVTLPSGGAVTVPDLDPFETAIVTVPVAMNASLSGIQTVQFNFQYTHASMETNPQTAAIAQRANYDMLKFASITDRADGPASPWTVSSAVNPPAPWVRTQTGTSSVWHGTDAARVTDERLESPAVVIANNGVLKIEFDHTFAFDTYYDGGIIEMSRNDAPWTDIGSSVYNGYLYSGTDNPIAGRYAFTGTMLSPGHVTLNPAVSAGDVVRIRFRTTSDSIIGSAGWDIDNITFTGIAGFPFDEMAADSGCAKGSITRIVSSQNPANTASTLTITGLPIAAGEPAGTVSFYDGATLLGTSPIANHTATISPSLSAGAHSLTAHYNGSPSFAASTSAVLTQFIDTCNAPPTITYLSPPPAVPSGTPATLSVTATGGSYITYQWYRGEVGDMLNPVGTGTSVTVTVTATTKYWVRATNGCGSVNSTGVEVRIILPALFYTMTPCRLLDTRNDSYGALAGGTTRTITPYYSGGCYVPSNTRALVVNVTVVAPTANGFLTIFPGPDARPNTTTTSFRIGKTRSNNAIITMLPLSSQTYGTSFNVYNGSTVPVHFIIDVFGYFN